jgi:YHS domain-containing protein
MEGTMSFRQVSIRVSIAAMAAAVIVIAGSSQTLAADKQSEAKKEILAYPLDYCLVSGKTLGSMGEPPVIEEQGREIKFCCAGCIDEFKTHAATYLAKLDSAIIAGQMSLYPLETGVVSGESLNGENIKPVDIVYDNRLVRFSSEANAKKFLDDPGPYLAKLDQAVIDAQLADYPLNTCPVSGQELGKMGKPYDYVYGNRLVRFCCGGCVDTFRSNPTAYLSKIDAAENSGKQADD